MKNFFLVFILLGSGCFAQSKWIVQVGDTLFYAKNLRTTEKESADNYIVLKNKEWDEDIRKYIHTVDYFEQDTISKNFYKSEVFQSYRFGRFSKIGKNIKFWSNGNKSAEGELKKGRRIGFWAEWYKNGKKKFERKYFQEKDILQDDQIPSELINFWNAEGEHTVINGNGFYHEEDEGKEYKGTVKNYRKDGLWTGTRKDGTLIYKEEYVDGKLEKGESWDDQGKRYAYNVVFENTKYGGGREAFVKVIQENFKVPKFAIQRGIEGVVLVTFQINKEGKIQKVKVTRKLCDPCADAALKVVEKFDKWAPAKKRGQPVIVKYSLPLRIRLVSN